MSAVSCSVSRFVRAPIFRQMTVRRPRGGCLPAALGHTAVAQIENRYPYARLTSKRLAAAIAAGYSTGSESSASRRPARDVTPSLGNAR